MQGCFRFIGFGLLLFAAGCIWLLVKIKGTSDGPAALYIYFGAGMGLVGAWAFLSPTKRD